MNLARDTATALHAYQSVGMAHSGVQLPLSKETEARSSISSAAVRASRSFSERVINQIWKLIEFA